MRKFSIYLIFYTLLYLQLPAQLPNPQSLNTAADGLTATLPIGALDTNWYAAQGDVAGPTTVFSPARVVGTCAVGFWYSSPFPNANWIAYDFSNGCGQPSDCVDLYFRREMTLPATDLCGQPIGQHYCLAMDFFADNSVYDITVNGVPNYHYTKAEDPYTYNGYQLITSVNLCTGWNPGLNSILVHVKSCPFAQGFLAQGNLDVINHFYYPFSLAQTICQGENSFGHTVTGIYRDTLLTVDGCDSIRSLELTVLPNSLTHLDTTICANATYDFYGTLLTGPGRYTQTFPSASGCDSVIVLDLKQAQHPFLGPDTTICVEHNYRLTGPDAQTSWFDFTVGPTKSVHETGEYWAKYTDTTGCEIVDSVFIRFNIKSFIPNIFHPDNSGGNDCFLPSFSETAFNAYKLSIFDRWGNLVFDTTDSATGWCGTYKGKTCMAGVYVYVIEIKIDACRQIIKGDVTLIN